MVAFWIMAQSRFRANKNRIEAALLGMKNWKAAAALDVS